MLMALKISISWPAGSGKSTLIKAIIARHHMLTADVGELYRKRALSKWLTIAEYDTLTEQNPQEDIEMEKDLKHIVENCPEDIIVSRRMWFHIMPEITSIWLDVSPQEWAKRVFLDDRGKQEQKYANIQEALEANQQRMERLRQRLLRVYGVDFTDKSHYTKVIDTTGKTFEQNLDELDAYIQSLKK